MAAACSQLYPEHERQAWEAFDTCHQFPSPVEERMEPGAGVVTHPLLGVSWVEEGSPRRWSLCFPETDTVSPIPQAPL